MKKKWTIISIIVGMLIMSVGVFVAVAKNRQLVIDPELKVEISVSNQFLRHMFYKNDPTSDLQLFHENDSKEYHIGLWHTIKGDFYSDINKHIDNVTSKVENKKVRSDLIRAGEFWIYAGKHQDDIALGYAYMIYHDLDKLINNYESNYGIVGVTEYQGIKGKKYEEMIFYYEEFIKK